MKYLSTLLYLFLGLTLAAQVSSDCTIPDVLREAYDRDVKGLAIKYMQATNSPDNALIEIPQSLQDSILEGMAAILNASQEMLQADSALNRYCVHDNANSPALYGFIIGVDTDSPIAQAWSEGNTLSGNAILDTLLLNYNFTFQNYFSFGAAVFYTDQILNLLALADSITNSVPGILYGEPDHLIGGAGRIGYNIDEPGNRFYEFRYEWNDCFDGCDNFYSWSFQVTPACEVIFTGNDEGGAFGIEPLPTPLDCMLFTDTDNPKGKDQFLLFPNPGKDQLNWKNAPEQGSWTLYNNLGQPVRAGTWSTAGPDTHQLPAGLYWFRVFNESGVPLFQKPWIKQ